MDSASKLRDVFLSGLDAEALVGFGDAPVVVAIDEIEAILDLFLENDFPHWSQQIKSDSRKQLITELSGLTHVELASLVRVKRSFGRDVVVTNIVFALLLPIHLLGECIELLLRTAQWCLSRFGVSLQLRHSDERPDLWRAAKALMDYYWPRGRSAQCRCCSGS